MTRKGFLNYLELYLTESSKPMPYACKFPRPITSYTGVQYRLPTQLCSSCFSLAAVPAFGQQLDMNRENTSRVEVTKRVLTQESSEYTPSRHLGCKAEFALMSCATNEHYVTNDVIVLTRANEHPPYRSRKRSL